LYVLKLILTIKYLKMEVATMYSMFYWIAIPATIIFGILILGSLIGFGDTDLEIETELDVDADADLDGTGPDFPILTIKNLFAFFTMFSWVGMACIKYGFTTTSTLLISTLSGVGLVLVLSSLYYMMSKLKQDTVSSISEAVGKDAVVYLRIPKNGKGQINVKINGSLQTIDAIAKNGKTFKNGESVKVVEARENELVVDSI
jgi:membrane protein implicated in regulation of membrane protease activity